MKPVPGAGEGGAGDGEGEKPPNAGAADGGAPKIEAGAGEASFCPVDAPKAKPEDGLPPLTTPKVGTAAAGLLTVNENPGGFADSGAV